MYIADYPCQHPGDIGRNGTVPLLRRTYYLILANTAHINYHFTKILYTIEIKLEKILPHLLVPEFQLEQRLFCVLLWRQAHDNRAALLLRRMCQSSS